MEQRLSPASYGVRVDGEVGFVPILCAARLALMFVIFKGVQ